MAMTAVRLSSLNAWNDVVLTLDEQLVRLYWRVLEFEGVIFVRCSMRSLCHPHVLSKYTTMAMTRVRLSSFHV